MTKEFYLIFEVKTKKRRNRRYYIGKQKSYHPAHDRYLGENDCYTLKLAIQARGRDAFEKRILMVCDSEEHMNQEYAKLVTPEVLSRWKWYNTEQEKKGAKKPPGYWQRWSKNRKANLARLTVWNKGFTGYRLRLVARRKKEKTKCMESAP